MAKKITKTKAKKHPVAARRIAVILVTAFTAVACFGTGCDWLPEDFISSSHEHIYSEWETTEATCDKDGVRMHYCIVCGEGGREVLPATGKHVYGGWTTTEEATCGEDGEREHSCTVCGHKESEVISATGKHTFTDWDITEPICGEDGDKERHCTVCGEKESEVIPAIGEHSYSDWVINEDATCGKNGEKSRICNTCSHEDFEVLPATGNHTMGDDNICTVCGYNAAATDVEIHFLELGNANAGDCTLIKCGDTEVLIDAGSKRNSTSTVKAYINQYCTDNILEYVIATHAHEDHIAALVGETGQNNGVMYSYTIGTIITYAGKKTTSQVSKDFETSITYAVSQGAKHYTAKQCWYETDGAKKQYFLDDNEQVSLNILYQKYYDQSTSNENNYSVCTLLSQIIDADTTYHYLFTGDLESGGETSLAESNDLPKCKLFKGGHHGSSTSSNDVLLSKIQPENIAICTCAGTYEYADKPTADKPESVAKLNTFPTQEALNRMAKYTSNIYVTTVGILDASYKTVSYTSMNGNIVFYTDNGELKLRCSNNTTILKETEWFKENRTWNGV